MPVTRARIAKAGSVKCIFDVALVEERFVFSDVKL